MFLRLDLSLRLFAAARALLTAGMISDTRIAIIAMTTSSSIRVKPLAGSLNRGRGGGETTLHN